MSLRDTLQNMSRSCCHRNWKRIRNGFRRGELILKGGICVECGGGGDAWHDTSELSMVPDTRWSFKKCLLNKRAEKWSSYRNSLVPKCGKNWSGRKVQNLYKTNSSEIVMSKSRASLDKGAGIFGICYYSGRALLHFLSVDSHQHVSLED